MERSLKYLIYLLLILPVAVYSKTPQVQSFNEYSGDFKVSTVNFDYLQVSFDGSETVSGEVIFELVPEDDYENEIYKVSFIPENISVFPSIESGFYAKQLKKIDLLNHNEAKSLIFSDSEWAQILKQKKRFVSKRGKVEIIKYATSVECDSRQYYAEVKSFSTHQLKVSYSENRKVMAGC